MDLKVVACDATLSTTISTVVNGYFRSYGFKPGDSWNNVDNGQPTQALDGGIIGPINGLYYMVGGYFQVGNAGTNSPGITPIYLYSSPDLYNWTNLGNILPQGGWGLQTRAHIIFNAATSKYVLWAHCSAADVSTNAACVATSSNIESGWTWQNTNLNPDGQGFKDCNLFVDDDGTGYVIYTYGNQDGIIVSRLASDYLTTSGAYTIAVPTGHREDPVLFRRGATYFLLFGGDTLYWQSSDTNMQFQTASAPLGAWSSPASLCASSQFGTAYNNQGASVIKLPGKVDGYVYFSTLWQEPVAAATHQLLPLTFSGPTSVRAQTPASWDLSYLLSSSSSIPPASIFGGAVLRGPVTIR